MWTFSSSYGPERVHRGHLREEAALAAVGALVEHEPRLARDERPVRARSRLELDHHALAAVADGEELLAAREDELDRPPRRARERGDVRLEVEVALGTEAAAEERHDDANARLGNLQGVSDTAASRVRHLRRRPHRELVSLPLRDDRAWLDRDALDRVGHVAPLHDDIGACEGRVGVSLDDRRVAERVAVAPELVDAVVAFPVGVDERRIVGECGLEVGHDGERLVVDLDQRHGSIRDLGGRRRDARDDIALEAHGVPGEESAILDHPAVEDVGHVLVGHDRKNPREGTGLRRCRYG